MADIEEIDEIPWDDPAKAWEDPPEKTDTIDKGFDAITQKLADFEVRLVNMANKLEEHLLTPDAHHVAMVARAKKNA